MEFITLPRGITPQVRGYIHPLNERIVPGIDSVLSLKEALKRS